METTQGYAMTCVPCELFWIQIAISIAYGLSSQVLGAMGLDQDFKVKKVAAGKPTFRHREKFVHSFERILNRTYARAFLIDLMGKNTCCGPRLRKLFNSGRSRRQAYKSETYSGAKAVLLALKSKPGQLEPDVFDAVDCCIQQLVAFYRIDFTTDKVLEQPATKAIRSHDEISDIQHLLNCGCCSSTKMAHWSKSQSDSFRIQFEMQSTVFSAVTGSYKFASDGNMEGVHLCSLMLLLVKVSEAT